MALRQFKETGEMIDLHPPKVVEQDTFRLCGTRHTIQVGVTRNQDVLTPFDDYFFVSFSPEDTSGGGKAMDWVTDRFEDAKEWAEDVGKGFEYAFGEEHEAMRENVESISEKMCKNCKTWACKGKWCMGAAAVNTWNTLGDLSRLWAETDESSPSYTPFRADEKRRFASGHTNCNNDWYELTGGCYHALEGAIHKIRIVITNTYDGRTTTKFDSELAGCFASYEADDDFCPSGSTYKRFIINSPGEWVIKITPLGS